MKSILKIVSVVVVSALISMSMTGCGGNPAPDAESMTTIIDKSLDKTFASRNNGGNVFKITDVTVTKVEQVKDDNYVVVADFKVTANDRPAMMAMSMTYTKDIMAIRGLKKGQSRSFKGVTFKVTSTENGMAITKAY